MITLATKDKNIKLTPETVTWLNEVSALMNESKLIKQQVFDVMILGTSAITAEQIVEELTALIKIRGLK